MQCDEGYVTLVMQAANRLHLPPLPRGDTGGSSMKAILGVAMAAMVLLGARAIAAPATAPQQGVTSPPTYEIGCPIPEKRIAVMKLNVEGRYSEQVRQWLPALIEDKLLKQGWTLVVRGQRMADVQAEHNLPGIKPETRPPADELLGATALLELNCRTQVKDIQGAVGYKIFTIGDFTRASVDLNGQIVDPATGVLKSSVFASGSASGIKTALAVTINSDWRIGAGGYNLEGIRETLIGKAADTAVTQMVARLIALYPCMPGRQTQQGVAPMQPASTTITAEAAPAAILITLPDKSAAAVGDHYGVYRGDQLVAEVEVLKLVGTRARAQVISQSSPIQPTDTARKMPVEIQAQ